MMKYVSCRNSPQSLMGLKVSLLLLLLLLCDQVSSFSPSSTTKEFLSRRRATHTENQVTTKQPPKCPSTSWRSKDGSRLFEQKKQNFIESADTTSRNDMNPLTRASWYAVEAFGNIFGRKQQEKLAPDFLAKSPSSIEETLQRIQLDNDRSYFLSGEVDMLIYDEDCLFADPFVAFRGRQRFVVNLQNLGSFVTKYSTKLLEYNTVKNDFQGDTDGNTKNSVVTTRLMVKLELNLPWKPVLAWPWGVRYEIDPNTNLIVIHKESWNIEPLDGVKQIFRKPTTQI